jgi:hypothetical protein
MLSSSDLFTLDSLPLNEIGMPVFVDYWHTTEPSGSSFAAICPHNDTPHNDTPHNDTPHECDISVTNFS